jgi:coproporphyrinogen III oxidase
MKDNKKLASQWFQLLRDRIVQELQLIETNYSIANNLQPGAFEVTPWMRKEGGGGEMSIIRGNCFEKLGVNISTVFGDLDPAFRAQIPGTEDSPEFFATGISVVSHPSSPMAPIAHFNTRYISTTKSWFGGGADLTPIYPNAEETKIFHQGLKDACDKYRDGSYQEYAEYCDRYFYLPHRKEPRGVGGIFFDYLNSNSFDRDFTFAQEVGLAFLASYSKIVKDKINVPWDDENRKQQLIKRSRYVEFNLLYDRGTKFGLMTNGNIDAILMSMPPMAIWP